MLGHPAGHLEFPTVAVIIGGPMLYLVGNTLFKWAIAGLAASYATPLSLSAATTVILVIVAGWETVSLKVRPRKPAEIKG